ncbi:MAG: protease [Rubrobacteraceae bacterium]|nr:protease [Rubrobacteraceae bacterium]
MEAGHGQHREGENAISSGRSGGQPPEPPGGPPPAPPSGPSRRGRGLLIGGAIVFGLLFLMVGIIALVLIAGYGRQGGGSAVAPETFDEEYVSGQGADKIAVLPVVGTIGSQQSLPLSTPAATPTALRNQLRQAAEDRSVKAVVLEINSPGGSVVASDQMHESIREFKQTTNKPVVVSMGETAASGGYYIATAADKVVANESTLTGSLGVIFSYLNFAEAADKLGLKEEVVKSGKFKDIGSPTREPTEEELEILQSLIDESYDGFVKVIVEGRGLPEDQVRKLADGRVYSGLQAKSLGLVDELGDLDRAAELSGELAGVRGATVVRYKRSLDLLGLLQSRLAPSEPDALKVLETAGLSPTPELQYLYRP